MTDLTLDSITQLVSVEDPTPTPSVVWDKAAQEAVIGTKPGPTIASRTYAMVHTAMYDAWSAYEEQPISTTQADALQRPASENTIANKSEAMSYAAYHTLVALFPEQREIFDQAMEDLGYDPSQISLDTSSPAGIGYASAQALLEYRQEDGSNQLGDSPYGNGTPYSSTTSSYLPTNNPEAAQNIELWTPEFVPIDDPTGAVQQFLTPQWGDIEPFSLENGAQFRPEAPEPFLLVDGQINLEDKTIILEDASVLEISKDLIGTVINPEFIKQAEEVVEFSANLDDEQKLIAEFWEDGGGTSFPPGTWMTFGQYVSARDEHSLDDDAQMFFSLGNAVFDAGISSWEAKVYYDYARPVRVIRTLGELGLIGEYNSELEGYAIEAWKPEQGTQTILATDFLTYQTPGSDPSPPFAEYTSGHSAFSAAGAEVLQFYTESDQFGAEITFDPGVSRFEPEETPQETVTLSWDTFSEAADEAGISRLYGGIHFEDGDLNGRLLGREVGNAVLEETQHYINGGTENTEAGSVLDFDEGDLSAGTIISDQFTGMQISSDGYSVMIFDTANPTGGDTDLASETLGKVLILSEDGDSSNPDDNATGGTINFDWDDPVSIESVGLLDIEEVGGSITLYDYQGARVNYFGISDVTEDGGTTSVDIGSENVSRMELSLVSSGAVTDINYFG